MVIRDTGHGYQGYRSWLSGIQVMVTRDTGHGTGQRYKSKMLVMDGDTDHWIQSIQNTGYPERRPSWMWSIQETELTGH